MELARLAGRHGERDPRGRDRHPGAHEDPRVGRDHRGGDAPQPDRPDDDDAGRRERDPRAVAARGPASSAARSSASTAPSSSPARGAPTHERPGHRRRVGQRRPRRPAERLPAPGETVLGGTFERLPRRQGRQPGRRRRAARRARHRSWPRSATTRSGTSAAAALEAEGVGTGAVVDGSRRTATGVALILVDARRREPDRRRARRERGPHRGSRPRGARRPRPGPGDVVLVNHEIPDDDRSRGAAARPRARRDDRAQPGSGRRARSLGPVARRRR